MRGLINEKEANKVRKIDKTLKIAKVIFKRLVDLMKIVLIVGIIVAINVVSTKITNILRELTFQEMKIGIFSIISFFILFQYLRSCEEVKGVK